MKPEAPMNEQIQPKQNRAVRDLLDAVEGMPSQPKAAMLARIMKDVVAGKISAAEALEISRAGKM